MAVRRRLACVAQRLPARPEEPTGVIDETLADGLARAAARNVVAHAYDHLDMTRVFRAANDGAPDLEAFLAALADRL
jgi:uncharacterized protein YutE (UPF0331/DUF86 family)